MIKLGKGERKVHNREDNHRKRQKRMKSLPD